jgi:hypothetical protein
MPKEVRHSPSKAGSGVAARVGAAIISSSESHDAIKDACRDIGWLLCWDWTGAMRDIIE